MIRRALRTEHQEQALVIQWAEALQGQYPELWLLHAVPNGGDRHVAVAKKLKAEGVKPGVPDLHLPVPRGGYSGLWVEMKRRDVVTLKTKPPRIERTEPSEEQLEWHRRLEEQGYRVAVCWSAEQAEGVIEDYLNGGEQ